MTNPTNEQIERILAFTQELSNDDPLIGAHLLLAAASCMCRTKTAFLQTAAKVYDTVADSPDTLWSTTTEKKRAPGVA